MEVAYLRHVTEGFWGGSPIRSLFWRTKCKDGLALTYLQCDELRPPETYDDYVEVRSTSSMSLNVRRTRLSTSLSATERLLSQPLVCGTVFHRTSLLPPLRPSSAVVLTHFFSLSYPAFRLCTVPAQTRHFGHIIVIIFNILVDNNVGNYYYFWSCFWNVKVCLFSV